MSKREQDPMDEQSFVFETEDKINSSKQIIRQKLLDLYDQGDADWITEVSRPFSDREEGLSKLFHEHADVFFDALISIVETNREIDPEKTKDFLVNIRETFLSYSPNISNYLGTEDMLVSASKVNRIEEMRGLVGQTMVGEFVYNLSFADDIVQERIIKKIENLPSGEREESINQLEVAYANALANGEWSERAVTRIQEIVSDFTDSNRPLTRIVSEVAKHRMEDEDENPSLGVVTYRDNKGAGRLHSHQEIKSVSDKFESNLPRGYKAVVVAKDVIVGSDHAGMPRFGAIVEKANSILDEPDLGLRVIQGLRDIKNVSFFQTDLRQLVNLLANFYKTFESDKTVHQFYAELLDISEEEMKDIIDSGADVGPFFQANWEEVRSQILSMTEKHRNSLKDVRQINFESFDELSGKSEINPFGPLDKNDRLLLAQCLRPEVRSKIEEELGFSFSDISFRAEVSLLRFLSEETNETYKRLYEVLQNNPEERARIIEVFVGCSQNLSFGQEFLSICEDSRGNELKTFLDVYSGVVMHSEELQDIINTDQRTGKITPELTAVYTKIAIKKSYKMLQNWKADVATARKEDREFTPDPEKLQIYQDQEVQSAIFASVFQQLRKEHGVGAFEILGGFESKSAIELSDKEKMDVESMYRLNYEKKDPELCNTLIEVFRDRCTKDSVKAYMLKDKEKVVSILTLEPFQGSRGYHRAEDVEPVENSLYFGSFNTDVSYQGATIGDAMMKKILDEYAKGQIIYADCSAHSPIGAKYIEDGFIATSFYDYKNSPSLEIVRDDKNTLITKQISKDVFVKDMLDFELAGGEGLCQKDGYFIAKATQQDEIDMETYLNDSYILTRFFQYGVGENKNWYGVFEKRL